MKSNMVFQFEDEGVIAYIEAPGRVVNKTSVEEFNVIPVEKGFQPKRIVMKIKVENGDNNEITDFDPPLELHVRFTPSDVFSAKLAGVDDPVLAYWDGVGWVEFTQESHNFTLIYDNGSQIEGVGVAKIVKWVDPWIAWGP